AINYLSANVTAPAATVAFGFDSDSNGQTDSLIVFQDGVAPNSDVVVQMNGLNGVALGNAAGQNVVQIVDTTAPSPAISFFASGASADITTAFSENVQVLGAGTGTQFQLNGAGAN